MIQVQIQARGKKSVFPQRKLHTDAGVHPPSPPIGTGVLIWGNSGRGVNLTIRRHLVPRLRMSGARYLLPLCDRDNFTFSPFTMVNFTAAKCKCLIFLVLEFVFSSVANIFIVIILYGFCFLLYEIELKS
jgi:hypothetical protein